MNVIEQSNLFQNNSQPIVIEKCYKEINCNKKFKEKNLSHKKEKIYFADNKAVGFKVILDENCDQKIWNNLKKCCFIKNQEYFMEKE